MIKVWLWLKKYWKWLIFPIGILVFVLGRLTSRKLPAVIAPELLGAAEVKEKADRQAVVELRKLDDERQTKVKEIEERHSEVISKLTDDQKKKYEAIKADPNEVNNFLLDIGKDIRNG